MENSQNKSPSEGTDFKELRLLEELEETPQITQRNMADRLGIALGVANLLTKNLIKKGYVRATKVGWRRWVYTLTPEGFTRKLQLTRQYVDRTIDHYRRIKLLLRAELDFAEIGTGSRVGIVGKSELSEIVYLALGDLGVTKIGFFDDKFVGNKMFNLVIKKESDLNPSDFDIVISARLNDMNSLFVVRAAEYHSNLASSKTSHQGNPEEGIDIKS